MYSRQNYFFQNLPLQGRPSLQNSGGERAAEAAHAAALDAMPRTTTGAARATRPLLPLLLSCLLARSAAASEPPAHSGRIVGPGTIFASDAGPVVGILTARKDMDCTGTLIAPDGEPPPQAAARSGPSRHMATAWHADARAPACRRLDSRTDL